MKLLLIVATFALCLATVVLAIPPPGNFFVLIFYLFILFKTLTTTLVAFTGVINAHGPSPQPTACFPIISVIYKLKPETWMLELTRQYTLTLKWKVSLHGWPSVGLVWIRPVNLLIIINLLNTIRPNRRPGFIGMLLFISTKLVFSKLTFRRR